MLKCIRMVDENGRTGKDLSCDGGVSAEPDRPYKSPPARRKRGIRARPTLNMGMAAVVVGKGKSRKRAQKGSTRVIGGKSNPISSKSWAS